MPFSFSLPEPHDARVRAQLLDCHPTASEASNASSNASLTSALAGPAESRNPFVSARARRQFSLFAAGATFVGLSTLVTRRALVRKYIQIRPAGIFSPSNKVPDANGGVEAAEALYLATLNVASVALMLGAGALWALDISTVEEFRYKARKQMGLDDSDPASANEEEDAEQWVAFAMAKLAGKSDQEIANMVKQLGDKTPPRKELDR